MAMMMPAQARKKKKETPAPAETEYHKVTGRDSADVKGVAAVVVHEKKYYLELPCRLFGRQFLVVNRMQQVPRELNDASATKGTNYSNMVVFFEHDAKEGVVRMREQRPTPLAEEGQMIAASVRDNYINPILAQWEVKAMAPDSSTVIFPIHALFNGEETILNDVFNSINIGQSPSSKLSRLISIQAYNTNIVAKSELTTVVHEGNEHVNVSVVTSTSLCLLPETPMRGREADQRVGYFFSPRIRYTDNQQRPIKLQYVNRWRLEPSDTEAYMRGELTEPVKPITIYLDPYTPRHLRQPIKQGIEDWNEAFKTAGFKNAIRVIITTTDSVPQNDETTVPADFADDMKYSTLTYVASHTANAMGPSITDPRTGEILEADIMWWHNVSEVFIEWLRVQTTPYSHDTRQLDIPDSLIAQAARFVACHEMGHSLGLRHNYMASAAIPTDSLLSTSYVNRTGCYAPSIMDYARYNYVAQEGSGMPVIAPHIGEYDLFAIEWGYRWWPDEATEQQGLKHLMNTHTADIYRYQGDQPSRTAVDPRAMSEDLGDNPIYSATLGTQNLKIIVPNIIEWTTSGRDNQTYEDASAMYLAVMGQWNRYNYHVLANIGGLYMDPRFVGDGFPAFRHVEKGKQKLALKWLVKNTFTYPAWLFNTDITRFTYIIRDRENQTVLQAPNQLYQFMLCYIMWDLLDNARMMRMADNELANGRFAFTATEMMQILHEGIFAETIQGNSINIMQRFVQKTFVDALITAASSASGVKIDKSLSNDSRPNNSCDGVDALLGDDAQLAREFMQSLDRPFCSHTQAASHNVTFDGYGKQVTRLSDPLSVKRGELTRIEKLLRSRSKTGDQSTRDHYSDLLQRIETALAPHY